MRPSFDRLNNSTGFSRLLVGSHFPCAVRGTFSRIAFPISMRSSTVGPNTDCWALGPPADFWAWCAAAFLDLVFIETPLHGTIPATCARVILVRPKRFSRG